MITGRQVNIFAYPTGGYTKEAQDLLRKSGYLMAFTTNRGFDKSRSNNDIFALRRIKVTNKDNWFKLWVKLSGIYNLFQKFSLGFSLQNLLRFSNSKIQLPLQYTVGTSYEVINKTYLTIDRKSTRLNSSHTDISRMPSSA